VKKEGVFFYFIFLGSEREKKVKECPIELCRLEIRLENAILEYEYCTIVHAPF